MTKRNIAWLSAIVVIGAVASLRFGIVVGLVAAAITLVASEIVERVRRRRRRSQRSATSAPNSSPALEADEPRW